MKNVTIFENHISWQKARELTREIYSVTTGGKFEKDFGLRSQIQRASVSIMSNIAEGFDRAGRAEFLQYLVIAKGSCAEVRSQLYVANDIGYISNEELDKLKNEQKNFLKIIGVLRSAVQKLRDKKMITQSSAHRPHPAKETSQSSVLCHQCYLYIHSQKEAY